MLTSNERNLLPMALAIQQSNKLKKGSNSIMKTHLGYNN
jgi:hypothetical protein